MLAWCDDLLVTVTTFGVTQEAHAWVSPLRVPLERSLTEKKGTPLGQHFLACWSPALNKKEKGCCVPANIHLSPPVDLPRCEQALVAIAANKPIPPPWWCPTNPTFKIYPSSLKFLFSQVSAKG